MIRRLWPIAALIVAAGMAAAAWWLREPAPSLPPSPGQPPSATAAAPRTVGASPVPVPEALDERPVADYDRYRREMRRIRAAREEAQALQENERCIHGQRFRKDGSAWTAAGDC